MCASRAARDRGSPYLLAARPIGRQGCAKSFQSRLVLGPPGSLFAGNHAFERQNLDGNTVKVNFNCFGVFGIKCLQAMAVDDNVEMVEALTCDDGRIRPPSQDASGRGCSLCNSRIRDALEPQIEILRRRVRSLKNRRAQAHNQKWHPGNDEAAEELPLGVSQRKVV